MLISIAVGLLSLSVIGMCYQLYLIVGRIYDIQDYISGLNEIRIKENKDFEKQLKIMRETCKVRYLNRNKN